MEHDDHFFSLHEHIRMLLPLEDCIIHDEEKGILTYASSVSVSMPVELDVVNLEDAVSLRSTPPIYYANTSLQPVFHQMSLTIVKTEEIYGE